MESPFDVHTITQIPKLTVQELKKLEHELSAEFRAVSKQYLLARMVRIDHILGHLDRYIQMFQQNEKAWTEVYKTQIQAISRMRTYQESLCDQLASEEPVAADFEGLLNDLVHNIQSPFTIDTIFSDAAANDNLPFKFKFDKMIDTAATELSAVLNENRYQTRLISASIRNNREIIWRKFQRDVVNYKYYLLDKYTSRLASLYKSRHLLQNATLFRNKWDQYHKAVTSLTDIKNETNLDNFYHLNTPHVQKNRIELTNIRQRTLKRQRTFEAQQEAYSADSSKRVKLSSCSGLTQSEINNDLDAISYFRNNKDKFIRQDVAQGRRVDVNEALELEEDEEDEQEEVAQPEIAVFESEVRSDTEVRAEVSEAEDDQIKESDLERFDKEHVPSQYSEMEDEDGDDEEEDDEEGLDANREDDDEEINESNDDMEHPRTPKDGDVSSELQQKYRQLLSFRPEVYEAILTIPELPPIERFPNKKS